MSVAIALIVLAIVLGLFGLLIEAVTWLLFIAAIVLIAGAVTGFIARGKARDVAQR